MVLGRLRISTDTALRLGRYFGITPEFWINLLGRRDLDVAERTLRLEVEPHATTAVPVPFDRAGAAWSG